MVSASDLEVPFFLGGILREDERGQERRSGGGVQERKGSRGFVERPEMHHVHRVHKCTGMTHAVLEVCCRLLLARVWSTTLVRWFHRVF